MEMNWSPLRPGQHEAISTIVDRVQRGEKRTTVVLPTRYGKSDVIRVAALQLRDAGLTSCSLALSPATILARQLNDVTKWNAAIERYEVKLPYELMTNTLKNQTIRPNENGEVFVSATTQLVSQNLDTFALWVESEIHQTGMAPVVFIDECHTGSEANKWGAIADKLVSAGSHVVLLTATAERSDSRRVNGFRFEQLEDEEVRLFQGSASDKGDGWIHVKLFEGIKTKLRLVPDCYVSFKAAWDEDALCKISRIPFDVQLSDERGANQTLLSQLPSRRARRELGRLVRREECIREGCRRMVEDMRRRRETLPDSAGIVFCGNDDEKKTDLAANKHARQFHRILKEEGPEFDFRIVTSSSDDEDAADTLAAFQSGSYDGIIVKQMAGVGLDVPRLKTGLDLSPVRTYAGLVQRQMRVATPYKNVLVATWITPDDIVSKAIFKRLVKDQGGEASVSDLTLIYEYDKEKDASRDEPLLFANSTVFADFEDSAGNEAQAEKFDTAQTLMAAFPSLISSYSHAEIVSRVSHLTVSTDVVAGPEIVDAGAAAEAIRINIHAVADECTDLYAAANGIRYNPRKSEPWQEMKRAIWTSAYRAVGWPKGTELRGSNDLDLLRRLLKAMQSIQTQLHLDAQ